MAFSADVQFDSISGSLSLDNGIFKGLHRQVWCLRDERRSGEHGGSFESGSWVPRVFNTLEGVAGMGVGRKSDTCIQIDPGTYVVDGQCPALGVGFHQVRVQNLTDGITEAFGTTACSHSDEQQTVSTVSFQLTLVGPSKEYQIQHRCSGGRPIDGFGQAAGFPDSLEVYSWLKIQKVS